MVLAATCSGFINTAKEAAIAGVAFLKEYLFNLVLCIRFLNLAYSFFLGVLKFIITTKIVPPNNCNNIHFMLIRGSCD